MSRLLFTLFIGLISSGIVFSAPAHTSNEDDGDGDHPSSGWMDMVDVATKLISFESPKFAHLLQKVTKNMQGVPADHVRALLTEKCVSMAQAWTCFEEVKAILSENVNEIYETAELFKDFIF